MASRAIGTRRSTLNKRRKGTLSVVIPWLKRFGLLSIVCLAFLWLGAWLWMTGGFQKAGAKIQNSFISATADMGFTVENIKVEGRVYSNAAELKKIVDTQKGAPLFALKPSELQKKIEAMEWIKRVTVGRQLPGTLYIHVQEHTPLALWQHEGKLHLLNEEGGEINTNKLGPFKNLVVVMGKEAPAQAPELLGDLRGEPVLESRITVVKWVDGRRWDLLTKDNVTIKLPETDTAAALSLLAKAHEKDKVLEKDITAIDLREQGRIILRTRPGALEEYKAQKDKSKSGDNI